MYCHPHIRPWRKKNEKGSWSIGQPASQPAQSSRASGWHIGWGEHFPILPQPVAVGPVVTSDWHRQGWEPRLGPKRRDIDQLVV